MFLAEISFRDRLVDPGQVLINDPARAEIHVAHLGISHLSGWQTDIETARAQTRAGIFAVELVMKWRSREEGCISIRFGSGPSAPD